VKMSSLLGSLSNERRTYDRLGARFMKEEDGVLIILVTRV
jgi:hypothetical protein